MVVLVLIADGKIAGAMFIAIAFAFSDLPDRISRKKKRKEEELKRKIEEENKQL